MNNAHVAGRVMVDAAPMALQSDVEKWRSH
jgi:hypothetical protein